MKKVLVAVALMMSVGLGAQAAQLYTPVDVEMAQANEDVYKEVKLADLNEKVQATISSFTEAYEVKSLGYNEEKKETKVTLTAKDGGSEKVVLLNEEGKEI